MNWQKMSAFVPVVLLLAGMTGCADRPNPVVDEPETVAEKPEPIMEDSEPPAEESFWDDANSGGFVVVHDEDENEIVFGPHGRTIEQPVLDGIIGIDDDGNLIRVDQSGKRITIAPEHKDDNSQPEPGGNPQEAVIAEIEKLGGRVEVDEQSPDQPVVGVDFSGTRVGDEALKHLGRMTRLEKLNLEGARVRNAGLQHLQPLSNLRILNLRSTRVSDAGLAHLARLTALRELSLRCTTVTDSGLKHLQGLTELTSLNLSKEPGFLEKVVVGSVATKARPLWGEEGEEKGISDEGLEYLKGLPNLESLDLSGTRVSDDGVDKLRQALPDCDIRWTPIKPDDERSQTMDTKRFLELVGQLPGSAVRQGASGIVVAGKHAYLLDKRLVQREGEYELGNVFQVVDISDPAAPAVVGALENPQMSRIRAVAGDYAYVASSEGLRVLDVSNPTTPTVIETHNLPVGPMAVIGEYAYAVSGKSLCVLDVSNPKSPEQVGSCSLPDYGPALAVAGSYAYIACLVEPPDHGGLRIVDVSDPKAPKEVGFRDMPGMEPCEGGVAVAGTHVYIADSEGAGGAIKVVDVSDPTDPRQVSKYGYGMAGGLAVKGDRAYLACGALEVLDISNPLAPTSVEFHEGTKESDACNIAWNIVVSGDYVYVSGQTEAALSIFRITAESDKDRTVPKQ